MICLIMMADGDGWEECGSSDGSTEDISADVDMDTEEPVSGSTNPAVIAAKTYIFIYDG